jgi:hypothetical protein
LNNSTPISISETLSFLPTGFWIALILWLVAAFFALERTRMGLGYPMLAVLVTVAFWYFGDVFYNDYVGIYLRTFHPYTIENAWTEVSTFIVAFVIFSFSCHRWINGDFSRHKSHICELIDNGVKNETFQKRLTQIFWGVAGLWLILFLIAWSRLGADIYYYLFPFLGEKAEPWSRGRIGGGFDAFIALAAYLQIFTGAAFGVIAALSDKKWVRTAAFAGCLFTWPYYLFDRTRNTMLATIIPAMLAWTLFRFRGNLVFKLLILFSCFIMVEGWLRFVIENRSDMSISSAFQEKGFSLENIEKEDVRHEGLNMFEELCWLNTFLESGSMKPNNGSRYFAELVNPVPRVLWPGKPLIGIDYALARGMGGADDETGSAGVFATLSTGLIGQGVQNFGTFIGPCFAALLMGFWAAVLARLDLQQHRAGSTLLYLMGMVLTINLGRDITLLTLYPFLFGLGLSWWIERRNPHHPPLLQPVANTPQGSPLRRGKIPRNRFPRK